MSPFYEWLTMPQTNPHFRIREITHADATQTRVLLVHHLLTMFCEEVDGLYLRLARQDSEAKRGDRWDEAEGLLGAIELLGERMMPVFYALIRIRCDPLDELIAPAIVIDVEYQTIMELIDAIRKAIPWRRRKCASLMWYAPPHVVRIYKLLTMHTPRFCKIRGTNLSNIHRRPIILN